MKKEILISEIKRLKKEKNAIILAHTYQPAEIQEIADITGDSYALSKKCTENRYDTIVFCGVHFMAESAKILSPDKTVLLPEKNAGCPMADMVTPLQLKEFKNEHPNAVVVTYINSSAAVKAESDVIVTSSNAVKVVKNIEAKEIIFVPDKNLGAYVASKCPEKRFILWDGYCPVHNKITAEEALSAKKKHPSARLLVHPECPAEVLEHADFIGSTKAIIDYAAAFDRGEFIIGTEEGVLYPLSLDNGSSGKLFHMISDTLICENMKATTLDSLYRCLLTGEYEMKLDKNTIEKAAMALNEMLRLAEK